MKIEAIIRSISLAAFLLPVIAFSQSQPGDSLKAMRPDSLMKNVDSKTKSIDSLKDVELKKMNTEVQQLTSKINQLKANGLPVSHYKKKLDSVRQRIKVQKSLANLNSKIQRRQRKLQAKIGSNRDNFQRKLLTGANAVEKKMDFKNSALDSSGLNLKNPITSINPKMNVPQLPTTTLPGVDLNTAQIPNVQGQVSGANPGSLTLPNGKIDIPRTKDLAGLANETKAIQNQASEEIKKATTGVNEIKELKKETGEIGAAETKLKDAKKEVKEAMQDKEKIKELEKNAGKKLEQQASQVKELKELKQKNPLEEYKDMLADFKKQTGVREIKEVSMKSLTNPFIGQEEKLKAGMAELDKLKKKYGEVNANTFPLKWIHNSLKGKPFKDRLIPSLGFQGLSGRLPGLDLMPYFMYRVSGRVRLGVGFDYRIVHDNQSLLSNADVMGIRALGDFRVYKGWYFHVEGEWLHYGNVYKSYFPSDPAIREWSDRVNIGILRTYKISRRINGMYEAVYYAGDWRYFPQAKYGAIRFGLEYKLGMKKPKQAQK